MMEVDGSGSGSTVAAAYPGGEGEGHAPGAGTGRGGGERETSGDGVHAGKEEGGGGEGADGDVKRNRKWWESLSGVLFPVLTLHKGRESLGARKSALVIGLLYASHIFSAWGDRMWDFVVFLLLALLYPGSLLLPGVYGFIVALGVAVLGTLVGDWVDTYPRMKVVGLSLLAQNKLLSLCAVLLALMFQLGWNVCLNLAVFAVLSALVVLLGSGSRLATVANTIAIEKDWVVVLADGNENSLALLNANMRRIDLLCKLLAPTITGLFLQHTGPFATTLVVAGWNIVSFFGELGLVLAVYRMVPTLAIKKYRKQSNVKLLPFSDPELEEKDEVKDGGDGGGSGAEDGSNWNELQADTDFQDSTEEDGLIDEVFDLRAGQRRRRCSSSCNRRTKKMCRQLLNPLLTIKDGWKIYIRQDIARVGFALAALYLTVLGYSGVTSAYFLTQGLRTDLIGLCQGIGAIFGVTGTLIYPIVRKRIGTVRTGLIGINSQLAVLLFCALAAVIPANRIFSTTKNYYSPDCSEYTGSQDSVDNTTVLPVCVTVNPPISGFSSRVLSEVVTWPTLIPHLPSRSSIRRQSGTRTEALVPAIAPVPTSATVTPTVTAQTSTTSHVASAILLGSYTTIAPSRTISLTTQTQNVTTAAADHSTHSPPQIAPTGGTSPFLSQASTSELVEVVFPTTTLLPQEKRAHPDKSPPGEYVLCSPPSPPPFPPSSPSPPPSASGVSVALVLMLIGVIGARIGLWMFDLAVSQLVQETVVEEERGVVSGVINAMTSLMDMLHYVLVIAAPRPEQFNILTFISVAMVTIGALLYASYVHKVRGHLFHFSSCFHWLKRKFGRGGSGRGFLEVNQKEEATCLVITAGVEFAGEDKGVAV